MVSEVYIKLREKTKIERVLLELKRFALLKIYNNIKELEKDNIINSIIDNIINDLKDIENYISSLNTILPDKKEIEKLEEMYKDIIMSKKEEKKGEEKKETKKRKNTEEKKEENNQKESENKLVLTIESIEKQLKEIDEELSKLL